MKRAPAAGELFDSVCDELRPYCWPETFLAVAGELAAWRESRNPHHIDMAVLICSKAGAPVTPTLQAEMTQAAVLRLTGPAAGSADKPQKQRVLSWALLMIANLHHAGLDVGTAARKVAPLSRGYYKPATLERYFGRRMREHYETFLKPAWLKHIPDHSRVWREVAQQLPELPEA